VSIQQLRRQAGRLRTARTPAVPTAVPSQPRRRKAESQGRSTPRRHQCRRRAGLSAQGGCRPARADRVSGPRSRVRCLGERALFWIAIRFPQDDNGEVHAHRTGLAEWPRASRRPRRVSAATSDVCLLMAVNDRSGSHHRQRLRSRAVVAGFQSSGRRPISPAPSSRWTSGEARSHAARTKSGIGARQDRWPRDGRHRLQFWPDRWSPKIGPRLPEHNVLNRPGFGGGSQL